MNIAIVGLRHGHIFGLYDLVKDNDDFSIIGAFEDNEEARNSAINSGFDCNYNSLDEVLNDKKVDIVALGGCYTDRGNVAIKALNAGKHVLADKPLCTDLNELYEIEKAANKNNKKVSCMFTMRYSKKIVAVKKLIESGALGEINNIYFGGQHPLMYGRRPNWYFEGDKHGGVINDIAIHGIDILKFVFGLEVSEVCSAREWNKFASDAPNFKDSAQFMLKMDNNAGVLADVSYAIPDGIEFGLPYYWQFYVWGSKGTMRFSFGEEKSYYYVAGNPEPKLLDENIDISDLLDDFKKLISGEKDMVLTMEDVIKSTEATLKIQKSAI